jgi:hypothetical protein
VNFPCPHCGKPVPVADPWGTWDVYCVWCDRLCYLWIWRQEKGKSWQSRMSLQKTYRMGMTP